MSEEELEARAEAATDAFIETIAYLDQDPSVVMRSLTSLLLLFIAETARLDKPEARTLIEDMIAELAAIDTGPHKH